MTKTQQNAMTWLVFALVAGSAFQLMAKHDAAVLGMSALELALAGAVVSAVVTRAVKS
jgi:hypothetical protein